MGRSLHGQLGLAACSNNTVSPTPGWLGVSVIAQVRRDRGPRDRDEHAVVRLDRYAAELAHAAVQRGLVLEDAGGAVTPRRSSPNLGGNPLPGARGDTGTHGVRAARPTMGGMNAATRPSDVTMGELGIALACVLTAACTSPPPRAERPPLAEPAQPPTQPGPTIPSVEARAEPAPAAIDIGWSGRPTITRQARRLNRVALTAHRAGRYGESRDGFRSALADSPDHDMARFNLACALSLLGELDAAEDELTTVLRRDLRRFQTRWRGPTQDADLDSLRRSPNAVTIDAELVALRAAYERAHDEGIPAYFFHHQQRVYAYRPTWEDDDGPMYEERGGTRDLVAGIYLHDAKRFVPLTRGGDVAHLDLEGRRAVHASTGIEARLHDVLVHTDPQLRLVSTSPDPSRDYTARTELSAEALGVRMDPMARVEYGFVISLAIQWSEDGVDFALEHVLGAEPFSGALGRVLTPSGALRARSLPLPMAPGFLLLREGANAFAPPADSIRLVGKRLEVDGRESPIELDREYVQTFGSADDEYVVALQRRHHTDEHWNAINDATVTRVRLEDGELEKLATGQGAGWVVLGPDGALYIETGGVTQRWPTLDARAPEPTLPELHITMPVDPRLCENCG